MMYHDVNILKARIQKTFENVINVVLESAFGNVYRAALSSANRVTRRTVRYRRRNHQLLLVILQKLS